MMSDHLRLDICCISPPDTNDTSAAELSSFDSDEKTVMQTSEYEYALLLTVVQLLHGLDHHFCIYIEFYLHVMEALTIS